MNKIIEEINNFEKINLSLVVYNFEKNILKQSKMYENFIGLEDYKMNCLDYLILYTIWKTLKIKNKIQEYLIIMYSYYKLEEFHYPLKKFEKSFSSIEILNNTNIVKIINVFIL
tara:strand:- start:116 stop:457 length:342 start_codon:yes stop_codon:yes gene_type:complete